MNMLNSTIEGEVRNRMAGMDRINLRSRGGRLRGIAVVTAVLLLALVLSIPGLVMADQFTIADCSDCHGTLGATWAPPDTGSTRNTPAGFVNGDHDVSQHVPDGESRGVCAVCHGAAVIDYDFLHRDGVVNMADAGLISGGTYTRGTSFAQSNTVGVTSTCTNVSCHGDIETPVWGEGTAACDDCHKASQALSAKHSLHYNTATVALNRNAVSNSVPANYKINCGVCHDVDPGSEHADGSNLGGDAANGFYVDIVFNLSAWSPPGGASPAYSNGDGSKATGNFTYWSKGACSEIYCHSNGQRPIPSYQTPAWNESLDCTGCHEWVDTEAGAVANMSGAHGKHMGTDAYSYDCGECHSGTVADNTDSPIANSFYHIDGYYNVVFNTVGPDEMNQKSGTYDGSVCDTLYCHSDGKDSFNQAAGTPVWTGGPTTCTSCHDNNGASTSLSDAHLAHINTTTHNYTCDNCHSETVTNNQTATLTSFPNVHVDGVQNVVFSTTGFSTDHENFMANLPTYTQVGKTCDDVYCHSTVQADLGIDAPAFNSPVWDSGGPLACDACHAGKPADTLTMITGSHT